MAIEYVSHNFNFNVAQSCLVLTLQLRCVNKTDSAEYYLITFNNRAIKVDVVTATTEGKIIAPANATTNITVTYKDYTASPTKKMIYSITGLGGTTPPTSFETIVLHDDVLLSVGYKAQSTDTKNTVIKALNIKYNPDITNMKITTGDAIVSKEVGGVVPPSPVIEQIIFFVGLAV